MHGTNCHVFDNYGFIMKMIELHITKHSSKTEIIRLDKNIWPNIYGNKIDNYSNDHVVAD